MNRRHFIERTIKGAMLLGGVQAFQVLPAHAFQAVQKEKLTLRFAIASDGHYGQEQTEYERFHDEMMRCLSAEHERSPLSFCVFNGDLIHDDPIHFPAVKNKFDTLSIPYYVARGNHDRCDPETWKQAWGHELNYSFEKGDNAFIVLDTSNSKGDYLPPDFNWTHAALDKFRKKKNLFVFMHIPSNQWTDSGVDCKDLMKLFTRQENLRAVFHGHDHNVDDAKISEGKAYLFDSHIGGNWGTDYRGYRIVEITTSTKILTYQVNPAKHENVNTNVLQ